MIAAAGVLALLAGCAAGGPGAPGDQQRPTTLTVLAAASLTEVFGHLGTRFEHEHPGVQVRFSFDSSATLAEQVAQGAPADVLATADTRTMATVVHADANDGSPRRFATNTIVLVVPKDNRAGIGTLADLDKPGVGYVVCVPSAPCGAIAKSALAADHVTAPPKSLEVDVKSVLGKVELGEADAGLVYATDAQSAAGKVSALPVPHAARFTNVYPIVALAGSAHPGLARDWVHLVLSAAGRRVLRAAGFGAP
jgi:molybdate transport system substrate-binding protein